MRKTLVCAALALAAAGVIAPTAHAQPVCLQIGRIWSFKPLDRHTLIVEDELHRKFKVGLMGYCPRLPFKLDLTFQSNGGNSGLDCVEKGDAVVSHDVGTPFTCPVKSIVPYAPAAEPQDKAAASTQKQHGY